MESINNLTSGISNLSSDLTDPSSNNFKIFYGITGFILLVFLIKRYTIKRKEYRERNPVFFQNGVDPRKKTRIPGKNFLRSDKGLQCSFFFWMYVDNLVYKYGSWKDVFIKGRPGSHSSQSPSVFIWPKKNALRFEVSTNSGLDRIDIDDFPIRKWFSNTIVIKGTQVEIYRDALLVKTQNLRDNYKETSGDLWIGNYGGFGGQLSCVHYFSSAVGQKLIKYKHNQGPFCYPWWEKIWNKIRGVSASVAGSIKVDVSVDLDIPKWKSTPGHCIGKKIEYLGKTTEEKAKDAAVKKDADCIVYYKKGGLYTLYKNEVSGARNNKDSRYASMLRERKQDKLNAKTKKPKQG
jgi:hypothetical protein